MITKSFIGAFLTFCFSIAFIHAQTRFQKTYGGPGDEFAWNVIQTTDHGFLISGYTTSFGNGLRDAYIIKTDSSGNKIWSKTIGGTSNDEAITAIEDNGSYVIGGYTKSYGAGGTDGFLARLDLSGNVLWFKTYGTALADYALLKFAKTLDNGFILAYTLNIASHLKFNLIKTDALGTMLWTRSYGGAATDVSGDVVQTPDSNFLITGFTNNWGAGQHDFLIARADQAGMLSWNKTLGTSRDDGGSYFVTLLNNSEAFITGQTQSPLFGPDNIVTIKINYQTNNIIWAKAYGKTGSYLRSFSGAITQDNGFAADIHDYTPSINHDMGILKTDATGNLLWSKKYGGTGDDVTYCIRNTIDNGFAIVGYTTSFGAGGKDIYFVKTDALGNSSFISGCNESSENIQGGNYVYSSTSPVLPLVTAGNLNNIYIVSGSNPSDSINAFCACINSPVTNLSVDVCQRTTYTLPWGGTASTIGMYSHNYTNANGCDSTVNISLSITPTSTTNLPVQICQGTGYTLPWGGTASTIGIYSHNYTNANGCDSAVNISLSITPTSTTNLPVQICQGTTYTLPWGGTASTIGIYSHNYTNADGCDSTVNISLSITPTSTTNLPVQICQGASYTLPWGGTATSAGMYSHSYTNANGCDSAVNISISINPTSTTNLPVQICQGASYTLPWGGTANSAGMYSFNYSDVTGCDSTVTISLSINPVTTTQRQARICIGQSYSLPDGTIVSTSGTYINTLSGFNGCDSIITTNLSFYPYLSVLATGSSPVCEGNPATVSAIGSGGDGGPYSFSWNGGLAHGETITVVLTHDSTLSVIVTDGCGTPSAIDSVRLTVNPLPAVNFLPQQIRGCTPVHAAFAPHSLGPDGSSYFWFFGDDAMSTDSNTSHLYTIPGQYDVSLMILTQLGCLNSLLIPGAVIVDRLPEADFSQSALTTTLENSRIEFSEYCTDAASWQWNFGDGTPEDYDRNPAHEYRDTGTYTIQLAIQSAYGCADTAFSKVRVDEDFFIYVPNSFTPNGDGVNDVFMSHVLGIKDFEMTVLNRWGERIFYTNNKNQFWDGSYLSSNNPCQVDVYEYIIKVHDQANFERSIIGHVNLLR